MRTHDPDQPFPISHLWGRQLSSWQKREIIQGISAKVERTWAAKYHYHLNLFVPR